LLPGLAHATCSCPATDQLGFALGSSSAGATLFCSYPAVPGEDPHDFYCTYNTGTGVLVTDNDAGLCPPNAVNCVGPTPVPTPVPTPKPTAAPVCGNGVLEAGEACDDGNTANGDCCSSTCTLQDCTVFDLKDSFLRRADNNANEGENAILALGPK